MRAFWWLVLPVLVTVPVSMSLQFSILQACALALALVTLSLWITDFSGFDTTPLAGRPLLKLLIVLVQVGFIYGGFWLRHDGGPRVDTGLLFLLPSFPCIVTMSLVVLAAIPFMLQTLADLFSWKPTRQ